MSFNGQQLPYRIYLDYLLNDLFPLLEVLPCYFRGTLNYCWSAPLSVDGRTRILIFEHFDFVTQCKKWVTNGRVNG